jgi:hypothetical protein
MFMFHHQNARQNQNVKVDNKSFINVMKFQSLGMTLTNQNYICEEIRIRLSSGNASYHSFLNFLSSHMHSKPIKIKI